MLTLTLVTDGANDEMAQAASLAYNMGVKVKVVDNMGREVLQATPVAESTDVLVDEVTTIVDEPHPVLEREVVESTPETAEPVTPEG